jgi:hypothetical protein
MDRKSYRQAEKKRKGKRNQMKVEKEAQSSSRRKEGKKSEV